MSYVKERIEDYPQFNTLKYWTEKAVCCALEEKGIIYGTDFEFHKEIDNVPFNKNNKHQVDLVLKALSGNRLYVEIKGQMTYLEVNKLKYLLNETHHAFYILQLTEIDWINPYNENEYAGINQKSKIDFETQIGEMVDFVKGHLTAEQMSERSKNRLTDYINYRENDIERWKNR